jgi:ABC-type taurine transport system ATPase subunit
MQTVPLQVDLEVAHEPVFLADSLEEGVQLARDLVLLSPENAAQVGQTAPTV